VDFWALQRTKRTPIDWEKVPFVPRPSLISDPVTAFGVRRPDLERRQRSILTHLPNITREYILRIRRRPNIFFSIYFIIIYKSWGPGPSGAQKCLAYRRVEFQTHANSRWNSHGGNSLDNLFLYGPWFCFLYV